MNPVRLLAPQNATGLLAAGVATLYVAAPLALSLVLADGIYLIKLVYLAAIAIGGLWTGAWLGRRLGKQRPWRHGQIAPIHHTLAILNLGFFSIIYVLLVATSDSVPLISALTGADASLLSDERGAFLKKRDGVLDVLSYAFSIYISSVIPFCVILLFEVRSRLRIPVAVLMGWVCISILVKAMFLNIVLPLLSYAAGHGKFSKRAVLGATAAVVLAMLAMIGLAGYNDEDSGGALAADLTSYASTGYAASSSVDFLLWRAVVVPVLAAKDTLEVHDRQFGGRLLLGTTSGTVARLSGSDQVNIERLVFEHQYGGWSEIGNSNGTFVVDAYINFGIPGVFIFGVVAALLIRFLTQGPSAAMAATATLFAFFLLSSSLIGVILSNGFFLLIAWQAAQKQRFTLTPHLPRTRLNPRPGRQK